MKTIKRVTVIFTAVIIVSAGILVLVLSQICRDETVSQEAARSNTTLESIASKQIRPAEKSVRQKPKTVEIKPKERQMSRTAPQDKKAIPVAASQGQKASIWTKWSSASAQQFQGQEAELMEDGLQVPVQRKPYLHRPRYKPMLEQRQPQMISQDLQQHRKRYQVLEEVQRVQLSKEQQEHMKDKMFSQLPGHYYELFKNIDKMKEEQLKKSKQAPLLPFIPPDYLDTLIIQDPNQQVVPEPFVAE